MAGRSRVVVGGLPGVGKTTVLNGVVQKLVADSRSALLVVFGSVMLDEAKKMGVKDRDSIRLLPVKDQRELQISAARRISNIDADYVFIDTHFIIRTKEGLWPGLPLDILREINPTHIVLVEAPVYDIVKRREADRTRKRDWESEEEIQNEIEVSRQFMVVASAYTGAPMKIINNLDGRATDAMEELLYTLKGRV
ncbi:MAG: adenylate kinase [Conexivisphaerales archaeon]